MWDSFYGNRKRVARFIETLPNGVSYTVLDEDTDGLYDNTQVYIVPEGHYFFMGDNRDNSSDSRCIGSIPRSEIRGHATRILLSLNKNDSYKPRFERFFEKLK